ILRGLLWITKKNGHSLYDALVRPISDKLATLIIMPACFGLANIARSALDNEEKWPLAVRRACSPN
ncbi:hypothetical protein R3X44_24370, partial [Salmonella enterica subsp. enterica serovar Kentucky]